MSLYLPNRPEPDRSTKPVDSQVNSDVTQAQHSLDDATHTHDAHQHPDSKFGQAAETIHDTTEMASNSGGFDILLDGVNLLSESLPALARILDEISKVHPYIAIAVGAFRVVIELEVKRRDNDKKVNLLFLEMKNMMSALLQLQNVRPNHVGGDGITVGMRLESHIKDAATDIKECANACDTYMKKRPLVKVLRSAAWDETLKGFVQTFANRKTTFIFALSMHTGIGVDKANDKLDELMARMDLLLEFFQKTIPYEQRALRTLIQKAGGVEKALQQTTTMQELLERERSVEDTAQSYRGMGSRSLGYYERSRQSTRHSRYPGYRPSYYPPSPGARATYGQDSYGKPGYNDSRYPPGRYFSPRPTGAEGPAGDEDPRAAAFAAELRVLGRELADMPVTAMRKNMKIFERKFRMQQREIMEEMKKVVVHEGDRVISSVLAGPHERIIDPVLHEIWKDMRWRGIVKARHLVLALHDYYMQKLEYQERDMHSNPLAPRRINEEDAWTFRYLGLTQLQRITEALDDDASGYITVQEVNRFSMSRPRGWSLLHWLAYWAVGWQLSMTEYKRKIHNLLGCMQKTSETVRAPNRSFMSRYLLAVGNLVHRITWQFQGNAENIAILPRFQAHIDQEEAQLRENLEIAKYDIDGLDTLALVNGRVGLEKNLYVIVYLMLLRHLEVMRAAHTLILHREELVDAEASLRMIEDGYDLRLSLLSALFQQRRLSVSQETEDFACGIFLKPDVIIISGDGRSSSSWPMGDPDEFDVASQPPFTALKYPPHFDEFYPANDDGLANQSDSEDIDDTLRPLLGPWTGLTSMDYQGKPVLNILNFVFHTSSTAADQVVASPLLYQPWMCTHVQIVADRSRTEPDGTAYCVTIKGNSSVCPPLYLRLRLSDDGMTLAGCCSATPDFQPPLSPEASSETFPHVLFKRNSSPEIMAFYPSPAEHDTGRIRAFWRFAISAVLYRIRQRNFSWGFIKSRRDHKHRLVSLLYYEACRNTVSDRPSLADECRRHLERALPADLHFAGYVVADPEKFPWIIPHCMGRLSEGCQCPGLLETAAPRVRCVSCPDSGFVSYPGYGCVFCGLTECLEDHLRYVTSSDPSVEHCIVKTRVLRWTLDAFQRMLKAAKIEPLERARTIRRMLAQEDPPMDRRSRDGDRGRDPRTSSLGQVEAVESVGSRADKADVEAGEMAGISTTSDHVTESTTENQNNSGDGPMLCIGCMEPVTLPCWTCVECAELLAVCDACDEKGTNDHGTHQITHTLLRVFPDEGPRSRSRSISPYVRRHRRSRKPDPDPAPSTAGIVEVDNSEKRLGAVEESLAKLEGRFEAVENSVARMERMLATAMAVLNVPPAT